MINILLGAGLCLAIALLLLPNKKIPPQIQPIDYSKYELRFTEIQNRIDSLRFEINTFEQKTDTIKLQILRDETKIKNLDNHGIDSAFAELLRTTK